MKILLVCASLHDSTSHSVQCFCTPVPSSSSPVYLKILTKWFSSIMIRTHALVELVLGSSPTGSVRLERCSACSIFHSSGDRRPFTRSLKPSPLTTGCCIRKAAEYPCSFMHLSSQRSLLLRQQDPLQRIFLYTRLADTVSLTELISITAIPDLHWLSAPLCQDQNWPCFYVLEALLPLFLFLIPSPFLSISLQSAFMSVFYAAWSFFFVWQALSLKQLRPLL